MDAFNHCSIIESGKDVFHYRGYYKLAEDKDKKKEKQKERAKGSEKDLTKQELFEVYKELIDQMKISIESLNKLYHTIKFDKNDPRTYHYIMKTREDMERHQFLLGSLSYIYDVQINTLN